MIKRSTIIAADVAVALLLGGLVTASRLGSSPAPAPIVAPPVVQKTIEPTLPNPYAWTPGATAPDWEPGPVIPPDPSYPTSAEQPETGPAPNIDLHGGGHGHNFKDGQLTGGLCRRHFWC